MTGPEHYRQAEQLIVDSRDVLRPNDESYCEADRMIAEAQVHATLALVAASVTQTSAAALRDGINDSDIDAWNRAIGGADRG